MATSAGHQYTITVWYKSTAKPVLIAFTSTTGPTGAYSYLAQSPGRPPPRRGRGDVDDAGHAGRHHQPLDRHGPDGPVRLG